MQPVPDSPSRRALGVRVAVLAALVAVALIWIVPLSAEGAAITTRSAQTGWAHARVVENFCPSGCPQTQTETVVVHQSNSDRGIFICELQNPGNRLGRAKCMLDVIRYACGADPFPRFGIVPAEPSFDFRHGEECTRATLYSRADQMASAISLVTGSYECLRYVRFDDWSPTHTISRRWTASHSGTFGCPG